MTDIGLTHVALEAADLAASTAFYARYAGMKVVHERVDAGSEARVVWLSDQTRPFAIVLLQAETPTTVLRPFAHLGVGCESRERVDELCAAARREGLLIRGPVDSGYPVGYWAFLRDPDGHTLEISYGQEVGLVSGRGGGFD